MKNENLKKKMFSKKEIAEQNAAKRVLVGFNTGTRVFDSGKDYNRNREKAAFRKMLKGGE